MTGNSTTGIPPSATQAAFGAPTPTARPADDPPLVDQAATLVAFVFRHWPKDVPTHVPDWVRGFSSRVADLQRAAEGCDVPDPQPAPLPLTDLQARRARHHEQGIDAAVIDERGYCRVCFADLVDTDDHEVECWVPPLAALVCANAGTAGDLDGGLIAALVEVMNEDDAMSAWAVCERLGLVRAGGASAVPDPQPDPPGVAEIAAQSLANSKRWFPLVHGRGHVATTHHLTFGVAGEAGEVVDVIKKVDVCNGLVDECDMHAPGKHSRRALEDEMADLFTYLLALAEHEGIDLVAAWQRKQADCEERWG